MVRFLCSDHVVSGSSPTSPKILVKVERAINFLGISMLHNHDVRSHREAGPGHCFVSKSIFVSSYASSNAG